MKIIGRSLFACLLSMSLFTAEAADYEPAPTSENYSPELSDMNTSLQSIQVYLYNLGQYLGFSLGNAPQNNPIESAAPLPFLDLSQTQIANLYIPAITALTNIMSLTIFKNYGSTTTTGGNISVSSLIDQQPYQSDPGSQSVLNTLTTPDYSYCLGSQTATTFKADPLTTCTNAGQQLTNLKVVNDVIGSLPNPTTFFTSGGITGSDNSNLLQQLSSNSLLTPLSYSTESQAASGTSSSAGSDTSSQDVLTANSEAQIAENFIRYVSGGTVPIDLATWTQYGNLYTAATGTTTDLSTQQAKYTLIQYLSSLRTYAAQTSVGINNLYYILSKRMKSESAQTSEALNEYNMATWRLANISNAASGQGGNNQQSQQQQQWQQQIQSAPPETVQKEIALLLAEINYQLYLSRQQQERILLTNSILVIQSARSVKPNLLGADQNLGQSQSQ
ncbi:hypothetical protein [Legionella oakridgensis]|uniref:hypothetical protein n=1 Tax=Legionella oakridgensis TaxID=29423 RepID=UPI0003DE5B74|nr:hypothetical protein [Legionella oakridgensis]ETO92289.1 hypothetical protein LOR_64c17280 [Legionella oakridgensis RV-2-2007]